MATITITGIPPWDGDYEFDIGYFTNRELKDIFDIAGVRAGELAEEFQRGNNNLVVAVAAIAMRRNGKRVDVEALWDAPAGNILFDGTDEEDAADPPTSPPTSESNGTEPGGSPAESTGSLSESIGEDPQATSPPSTGLLGSGTIAV